MNKNLFNIVKQIVAQNGEGILADPQRLKPLVSAYASGEPKEDRTAFGQAIESGFYTDLKRVPPKDRARVKAGLVPRLEIMTGLDTRHCAGAIDLLEAVIFAPVQPGQSPQTQPAYQTPPLNQNQNRNFQPQYVPPQSNASTTTFCGKCGTQLQGGSLFCSKCGTKVGSQPAARRPQKAPSSQSSSQRPVPVQTQPAQPSSLSTAGIIARIGFALVAFGFFMPIACNMNGFEIASAQMDAGETFAGVLFYALFISALAGLATGISWAIFLVCVGSGIGAYFTSGIAETVEIMGFGILDVGAYFIAVGWIVALIAHIFSEQKNE